MNQPAFVWRNETRKSIRDTGNNFLSIQLNGNNKNPAGMGCKAWLFNKGQLQYLEQSPVRGFSSSVDERLHFGVGNATTIDSVKVEWPDDKIQLLQNVRVNQLLTVKQEDAKSKGQQLLNDESLNTLFTQVTSPSAVDFTHTEQQYFDFGSQRAVLQRYSQLGPPITTGDVNGDGLEDFFIGGASAQSGKIFIQNKNGGFDAKDLIKGVKTGEDLGAVFFDSDGDKDVDLLITGGSPEFENNFANNQPHLYNNDGKGNFTLNPGALPNNIVDITKVVTVADIDNDGDMDLFIGGRLVPQKYPLSPRSYVLQNDGGKFTDVTKQVCPALEHAGLVTGAVFTDLNNDKQLDLIVCGEWMPIRFFVNKAGKVVW